MQQLLIDVGYPYPAGIPIGRSNPTSAFSPGPSLVRNLCTKVGVFPTGCGGVTTNLPRAFRVAQTIQRFTSSLLQSAAMTTLGSLWKAIMQSP